MTSNFPWVWHYTRKLWSSHRIYKIGRSNTGWCASQLERSSMELFSRRRWRLVSAQWSKNLVIALDALSLLFCIFINTTAYHLGRYEPSSPISCRAPQIIPKKPASVRLVYLASEVMTYWSGGRQALLQRRPFQRPRCRRTKSPSCPRSSTGCRSPTDFLAWAIFRCGLRWRSGCLMDWKNLLPSTFPTC